MNRLLRLLVVAALVVLLGTQLGWRWVVAPMMGLVIWAWARATLRSFVRHGQTGITAADEPQPVGADEHTMYWCEECGTELVLTVRGSGLAPRHCATKMFERSEVLG